MHEEKIADSFFNELLNLMRHIANISNEDTKIGNRIFIISIIGSGHNCFMKSIVETLNMLPSTATRQVDTLVEQGLIRRDVSETDRRKVILALTEKGKEVNKRFREHLKRVMSNTLKTYPKEEILRAIEVFHMIVEKSDSYLPFKKD
ncbi:MAG: MarR family winged helix-turn-helix transcriptional regulator [Promethearchaeota archaeon]|jgi:DNA-binding MarR family transcriptional regulator